MTVRILRAWAMAAICAKGKASETETRQGTTAHTPLASRHPRLINGTMNTQCGTKTTIVPLDSKHYIRVAVPVPTPSGAVPEVTSPEPGPRLW